MFDRRIQNIGLVVGSNNLIINGDVVANSEILPTLAANLFRPEFELLSLEARQAMQADVNECVQKVLEQVFEKKLEEKLTEFTRPSTQWALYSTLKGYTISETLEQREMMVDSMIDRIQQEWNSTERLIIDSAKKLLKKMDEETLKEGSLFDDYMYKIRNLIVHNLRIMHDYEKEMTYLSYMYETLIVDLMCRTNIVREENKQIYVIDHTKSRKANRKALAKVMSDSMARK